MARNQSLIANIHTYLRNWYDSDDILKVITQFNQPNFIDEEDAWQELLALVQYIKSIDNENIQFDAQVKFVKSNIAAIFLREAPSYKLFWSMIAPEFEQPVNDLYEMIAYNKQAFTSSLHTAAIAAEKLIATIGDLKKTQQMPIKAANT